jgi:hypothetical protein
MPPRMRCGGPAARSHLPPSTGSFTASEGDFGVLRGTSIPSEINNMLIPKNPPTGQKPFEGSNPSLSASRCERINRSATARYHATKRGFEPSNMNKGVRQNRRERFWTTRSVGPEGARPGWPQQSLSLSPPNEINDLDTEATAAVFYCQPTGETTLRRCT